MIPIRENRARVLDRWNSEPVGKPVAVQFTMDEEWSPFIEGEATLPNYILSRVAYPGVHSPWGVPQGDMLALDLQTRYRGSFALAQLTGDVGGSVRSASARWSGATRAVTSEHSAIWNPGERILPLSRATELWGGRVKTVTTMHRGSTSALTAALRVPGGTHLASPTDRLAVRLRIRHRTDNLDGTTTFALASEDVRLHDYRLAQKTPITPGYTRIRDLVLWVLWKIAETAPSDAVIELAAGESRSIAAGQVWEPGQTAWDFLHPVLEQIGWSLYADVSGVYHLEPRTATTAPVELDPSRNLIEHDYNTALDDDWFDGAVVEYTDADPDLPEERFDVYAPHPGRTAHITRPGTRAIAGAAEQIVSRSETRARTANALALMLLPLKPTHRVATFMGIGYHQNTPYPIYRYGTIRSLTHSLTDGTTALKLRDTQI